MSGQDDNDLSEELSQEDIPTSSGLQLREKNNKRNFSEGKCSKTPDDKGSEQQYTTPEPVEHIDELPDAILRRILSQLRVWEQSICRLACKKWNDQLVNHMNYPECTTILVNPTRLAFTESVHEVFDDFHPAFRSLRIMRVSQHQVSSLLLPSFDATKLVHLDLFHCGPFTWSIFLDLLISCHRLEEIRVRRCPFKWPYDVEEWRNKYIEWLGIIAKHGNRFPDFKAVEFRAKDPHDVLYMYKLVSAYSTRLQRISFTCRTPSQGLKLNSGVEELDDMYETVFELFDALVEILQKFTKTVERFHAYLVDPPQYRKFGSISNSASHYRKDEDTTIMNLFCTNVLGRLDWRQLNLRSFCLYGGEISSDNIPQQTDVLRNFIKSQSNLEKVILPRMRFQELEQFEELLLCIPRNVKCIRVPIFGRMPDCLSFSFLRLREYYVEAHGTPDLNSIIPPGTVLPHVKRFSFYNCSNRIYQTVKIMTIVNTFPFLTELLIRDDGTHQCTRLCDLDVQMICRHLPRLKKLHMTNVDCVTDFGFTGIPERECKLMNESGTYVPTPGTKTGYAICSLRNLEYLFLSDIGFRVTNVTMIYGFAFQNLRFMTLEGYPKVTPWGVEQLVESLKKSYTKLKRWSIDFHDGNISQLVGRLRAYGIQETDITASLEVEAHE